MHFSLRNSWRVYFNMKTLIIPPLLLFDKKCFSYFGCQVENCCSWRCRLVHQDPCVSPCRNKQQSRTVTDLFIRAIEEYGLPSRVRSDKGGENVGVSMYMLEHPLRGPGRGSMIVGRNVHNQRIERLWRDVYEGVLYIYYHLFYHLEECVVLDPANPSDLDILHYVFVPRINRHLSIWKGGYIHHRIRTAGSR